jgi:glycosyltransferase involved in cell wall biosynthesis
MTSNSDKLTVIVPVYNEATHLPQLIDRFLQVRCSIPMEWIFIDDHSNDSSLSTLGDLAKKYNFRIFTQPVNQGKGAAIIRGIRESTGTIIMIQDADFEYNPAEIPSLIQPILENRADVVFGSRFLKPSSSKRIFHTFVNRFLTTFHNAVSRSSLTDMETCYKVFRSDLLKSMNLVSRRFGIEVELAANVSKTSARLQEIPISYAPRTHLEGKKIGWKDGVAALWHLIYFNFLRRSKQAFTSLPSRYRRS